MRQSASVLVALWIAAGLAGCAGVAGLEDDQLVLAGFTKTPATTPETTAALKALPAHRFVHQTVNGVLSVFAPKPHHSTGRRSSRSSGLQDTECDRRSAHLAKSSRGRRNVLAHAGSDAQEIPEFVVALAVSPG
jgi:hypothetical protein